MWCSFLCYQDWSVNAILHKGGRFSIEHTLRCRKRNRDLRRTERCPSADVLILFTVYSFSWPKVQTLVASRLGSTAIDSVFEVFAFVVAMFEGCPHAENIKARATEMLFYFNCGSDFSTRRSLICSLARIPCRVFSFSKSIVKEGSGRSRGWWMMHL